MKNKNSHQNGKFEALIQLDEILDLVDSIKLYKTENSKKYFAEMVVMDAFITVEEASSIHDMMTEALRKCRRKIKEWYRRC